jgi:SOS-response transcriptional repressor LexA
MLNPAPSIELIASVEGVELTEKQSQLLAYIAMYFTSNKIPPCIREMMCHLGYSSSAPVWSLLNYLEAKRCIVRREGQSRNVHLLVKPKLDYAIAHYVIGFGLCRYLDNENRVGGRDRARQFVTREEAEAFAEKLGTKLSKKVFVEKVVTAIAQEPEPVVAS